MAITCPNGHVNDDSNRFCDQCGARLEAAPAENTSAAASAPAQSVPAASGPSDASVTCPTCGQENLPGTAFCENCGAPLQPPQPVAMQSETGAAAGDAGIGADASEGIVCPNCGARNEPGHVFCEQCGAALQGASAAPANMPDQPEQQPATATAAAVQDEPVASQDTAPPIEAGAQATVSTTPDDGAMAAATASVDAAPPPAEAAPAPQPEPTPEPQPETAPEPASSPAIAQAPSPAPEPAPAAVAPEAGPQGEVCANCGAALPANAKFCIECGTKVERQPQMVRPTHCQNCGSELPANAKFCLECGTKVEMIPAGSEKPAAQPVEATYQQQAAESPAAVPAAPLPSTPDVAMQPVEAQGAPPETATPVPQPATASNARTYDFAEAAAPAPAAAPPQAPPPAVAAPPAPVTPPAVVPAQPAPMSGGGPRLVGPNGTTISLPPKNELVIGREDPISGIHPDIDMTAHGGEAGGVSRRHALLRQQNGQWSIVDLDSTNYTRVDGSRVAPHDAVPLHEGARVQFGRIEFTFHAQ